MDKDEIIRDLQRRLKIRVLQEFNGEHRSVRQLEREFAIAALDALRHQPAMAELLELD